MLKGVIVQLQKCTILSQKNIVVKECLHWMIDFTARIRFRLQLCISIVYDEPLTHDLEKVTLFLCAKDSHGVADEMHSFDSNISLAIEIALIEVLPMETMAFAKLLCISTAATVTVFGTRGGRKIVV